MMNRNIDILNIKKIYAHQLFNKDILLMKKESKDRHHFSFGEYYDEILLSGYPIEIQSYMLPIHQIIVFSLITKSPVNYTMNIQEAKAIRLADYLQSLGYSPVKQQGNSLWYKSPFREESEPSFKLNTALNHRIFAPHRFLFVSNRPNRVFSSWKSGSLRTLHCSDTCRNEVLIGILPRANVKNSTSPITANLTLPSALRTWQEAMRYAISSSKAVSLPKTSRTYGKRNNSRILAICSRASWTIFHS